MKIDEEDQKARKRLPKLECGGERAGLIDVLCDVNGRTLLMCPTPESRVKKRIIYVTVNVDNSVIL